MVGGFLGAGKTTTIARLASHYMNQGKSVGIVTNDQAYDLVDTHSLRAQGFRVGEVPGACFCCKFDDLMKTAGELESDQIPDVIIAEPVGSCTDLIATVIEPLRHLHGDRYEVGPLAVLLKPEHGLKILRQDAQVGFSPKAAYIFLKQIEEADVIVVNKIDKLSADEQTELTALIGGRFPGRRVLAISAKTGDNFDQLVKALEEAAPAHDTMMDVDYDVYAEGEAELGWLNCQVELSSTADPISLDDFSIGLVQRLREKLTQHDAEPAHLKVLAQSGQHTAIANLVGGGADVELSMASHHQSHKIELIVNARVAVDPDSLEQQVCDTVQEVAQTANCVAEVQGMQSFRPGRPVPTHRVQR